MSDTPRTDAIEDHFGEMPGEMRKLERELAAAKTTIARLRMEVEKAWEEGFNGGPEFWKANARWHGSRAKRISEGLE